MKTNPIRRRGFTLVELLVVIVIIASLAALSAPMIMGQVKKANKAEAISNSKQIGIAMFEFESEYGSFPDADTLTDVAAAFPTATVTGDTTGSNGYFKQLLQAGIVQSEEIFYAKAEGTRKPDGDISTGKALESREVGFGYVMNTATGLNTSGNPSRVIVVTPLAAGSATEFDADPFGGFAIALKIDQSASALRIRPSSADSTTGPAMVGGKNLLEADFWGSVTPTIIAPTVEAQ